MSDLHVRFDNPDIDRMKIQARCAQCSWVGEPEPHGVSDGGLLEHTRAVHGRSDVIGSWRTISIDAMQSEWSRQFTTRIDYSATEA